MEVGRLMEETVEGWHETEDKKKVSWMMMHCQEKFEASKMVSYITIAT